MTCFLFRLSIFVLISHSAIGIEINEEVEDPNYLYSTSVASMAKLLEMENKLLTQLKSYAKLMQQKLDMINLYQEMLHRPPMIDAESQEQYVSNPLNAYGLLRRLHQDWPKWLSYLDTRELIEQMQLQLKKAPSEKDLHLATEGLLRIESFYDLEASHMAKGLILDKQYNSHLNPADCMALGNHLLNLTEYSKSTHWFRTALRNYKQPYGKLYNQVLGLKRIKLTRAYALAIARDTDGIEKKPQDTTMKEWQKMADKMLDDLVFKASNEKIKKLTKEYLDADEQIFINARAKHKPKPTAMQLGCRGLWEKPKPHRLTCRYSQADSAFLRLAPLKEETLSTQPLIILLHQVLSDSEVRSLKNLSLYRTSRDFAKQSVKLFPLEETQATLQRQLNRRIMHILGVGPTDHSLHVYNYGLGGYLQRNSKSTCRGPPKKTKLKKSASAAQINVQERCHSKHIATMIIYASDVPLGGATIFPKLQLLVQPKKGNVLVWINRDNEKKPEKLAEHAVCPVVMGSRWVMSNCIAAGLEMLKQPCLA
ncbi:prolyl 4-hydroxylase subunit alpha-1-like [Drosophila albomicans]|uniref:Prolyl 4-hydroxylase subunit alpha-1-like n=1 Tax=Drosophila albomicans TaxID=7291 RepID=A0A6P8WWQ7_DROAB|nr:prolyl 4-hydroxylase subunit alpha-1-like [Drosophila albomicans]